MHGLVAAALAILLSTSAVAQPGVRPPNEAAGQALMQCVAHTLGQGKVSAANAATLSANGLQYVAVPPAFLQTTANTPYGKASYATVPSTEGQIWAVGYDGPGNACLVFAIGIAVQPVESRLVELFSIPNAWKPETAAPAAQGERKLQYGWKLERPKRNLTALISVRDLSTSAAKGMVMVTVSQTTKK
jgi:hypothetical protein